MELDDIASIAILVFSQTAFVTAEKIRSSLPNSVIYSLAGRVPKNSKQYNTFGKCIQEQYKAKKIILALCSTGIIIRSLAPLIKNKFTEPPVIAIAEDGSCVIPLLGATKGANQLAEKLALILDCQAAITTSGERRFGINLLYPPKGLKLINPDHAKKFISALLNGATVRIEGAHPWILNSRLPISDKATHVIRILQQIDEPYSEKANELAFRQQISLQKGRVSVVGLGPGKREFRTFSAENALKNADDIIGYNFYIDLSKPFAKHQLLHKSDNHEEIARANHALALASEGRHAVLISSGDPGIYAMASAVFEAWEQADESLSDIDLVIEPGISAAFAAAARFGSPLGHDFAVISLSDNLKSWEIIEKRLRLASRADMVLALYNPVSKTRKRQLCNAIEILYQEKLSDTIVALAHDISREGENLKIMTLKQLRAQDVTSRTVIFIGSSKTRIFRKNNKDWVYTPRSYK
ncbi:MAG: cobalt-precorrin 5A hydrolase / precorrin-3B C17-methyltransferase [Candidatus Tokpelaia sp. JSC188]|nr:MAG: cobalt-precorrin 5A hydrolase / precorrin-3B C17-methyltransferase [Candidatus Tokpelaia sp. JSC188]